MTDYSLLQNMYYSSVKGDNEREDISIAEILSKSLDSFVDDYKKLGISYASRVKFSATPKSYVEIAIDTKRTKPVITNISMVGQCDALETFLPNVLPTLRGNLDAQFELIDAQMYHAKKIDLQKIAVVDNITLYIVEQLGADVLTHASLGLVRNKEFRRARLENTRLASSAIELLCKANYITIYSDTFLGDSRSDFFKETFNLTKTNNLYSWNYSMNLTSCGISSNIISMAEKIFAIDKDKYNMRVIMVPKLEHVK